MKTDHHARITPAISSISPHTRPSKSPSSTISQPRIRKPSNAHSTTAKAASAIHRDPTKRSHYPLSRHKLLSKPFLSSHLSSSLILGFFSVISLASLATMFFSPSSSSSSPSFFRQRPVQTKAKSSSSSSPQSLPDVRISIIAPLQQPSTLSNNKNSVPLGEALSHMARRLQWTDQSFHLTTFDAPSFIDSTESIQKIKESSGDIIILLGIQDEEFIDRFMKRHMEFLDSVSTLFVLDSHPRLAALSKINGIYISSDPSHSSSTTSTSNGKDDNEKKITHSSVFQTIYALLHPEDSKQKEEVFKAAAMVQELYNRRTADDLLFCFLVLIDAAVRPVPLIRNSTKQANAGLKELTCMVTKCGNEIFQCITDPNCRTALDCLQTCAFNDQVCSYRCIVSYESPQLSAFSLCILQKHNCIGLTPTEIPRYPATEPMKTFQGREMTNEIAEDIFVGWLSGSRSSLKRDESQLQPFSWRVFAGKNAAYDHFPCQYQLFYPGKAKNSFWYQPVFKVKTIDGRDVWRQRIYRVRKKEKPGTFRLSVLDNGVISLEDWTILDCDENLSWCIFGYNGAASAAGINYTGAILTSASGDWPTDDASLKRIEHVLDSSGIKMWELSTVSNIGCGDAPLQPSDMASLMMPV